MRSHARAWFVTGAFLMFGILCPQVSIQLSSGADQSSEPAEPKAGLEVQKLLDEAKGFVGARKPEEGLKVAERAVQAARESGDLAGEALGHRARAEALEALGRELEQVAAHEEEAQAWAAVGAGPEQVRALAEAAAHLPNREMPRAEQHVARAIAIAQSEERRPIAASRTLSQCGQHAGQFAKQWLALPLLQAALQMQDRLVPDSLEVAETLWALGWAIFRQETGNSQLAYDYVLRSLRIRERLAPDSVPVAQSLLRLGTMKRLQGDYAAQRSFHLQALAVAEKAGPRSMLMGNVLLSLGASALEQGDWPAAREFNDRAIALLEKIGPRSVMYVVALYSQGDVYFEANNWKTAGDYYRRSLEIAEANSPRSFRTGVALASVGRILRLEGNLADAREYLRRSISLSEERWATGPGFAWVLEEMGLVERLLGDFESAETHFRRAIEMYRQGSAADHPYVAGGLSKLAETLAARGEAGPAMATAAQAEQIAEEHLRISAQGLTEREALLYAAARSSGRDVMLTLAALRSSPGPFKLSAWQAVIRSRALVLDEMASRNRTIRTIEDPEISHLWGALVEARQKYARLFLREADNPGVSEHALRLARQEREAAERALADKSRSFGQRMARDRVGLEQVSRSLDADSALVAYVRYRRYEVAAHPTTFVEPVPSYLAFVLTGGSNEPTIVPLGPAEEIEGLVSQLRGQISEVAKAPDRGNQLAENRYRETGRTLGRMVWEPVASRIGKSKRVFIVPDGGLHLVNFGALPVAQKSYLIETGTRLHYLSAERDIVHQLEDTTPGTGILVVGAPSYDERSLFASLSPAEKNQAARNGRAASGFRGRSPACQNFQATRFEPLPASASEAETVLALWKQSDRALRGGTARGVWLTAAQANELAIKQQAPGKNILHLATHGFFLGSKCESALASRSDSTVLRGENPLLLAGLALAGANHRRAAGPDEEDGILTAEEIASLDLSGVEWAVLSACDTGLGEIRAGEGVLGLRRAFEVAGARTLIMSLWPVEDQAAKTWMTELYRARLEGKRTTIDAAHEASLKALRRRRTNGQSTHPFYWAGFVASGDWR